LIDAARGGDSEALGELLSSYRKYVVFLARTQLHQHMQGKADPSDVAQEVFMAAHGNIADFRGTSAEEFAAWLRGILTNTLAMHVRKFLGTQKRDPRLEQRLNHSLDP
jgi:RNA polymerase sigma-70 factor (ECF subfamily)